MEGVERKASVRGDAIPFGVFEGAFFCEVERAGSIGVFATVWLIRELLLHSRAPAEYYKLDVRSLRMDCSTARL